MPGAVTVICASALLLWSLHYMHRRFAIKSILRVLPRPPNAGFLTGAGVISSPSYFDVVLSGSH
jgi:hypothetical protein